MRLFWEWGCAQVVEGLPMRLLSRPLGVVRIRWGICRRGWCGCCGGSAGVRRCVAWPCFVAGRSRGVACAVLLRAGRSRRWGRVDVPPILGQGGGGVHCSGPCGTRPWRVFGVCVGWLWGDLSDVWAGALVQTNSVRYGLARTASLLARAAHTRAVMRIITAHLCDSLRRCGRMCRAWVRASASWGGTNATRCSNPLVRTPQHPPSLCVVDYPLFLVI